MAYNEEPRVSVSLHQKVNLGNYECAEVGIHLTQIPYNANETLVRAMMDTAEMAIGLLRPELQKRVGEAVASHVSGEQMRMRVAAKAPPLAPANPIEDPYSEERQAGKGEPSPETPDAGTPTQRPRRSKKAPATDAPADDSLGAQIDRVAANLIGNGDQFDPRADEALEGEKLAEAAVATFIGNPPTQCDSFGISLSGWPRKLESWTKPAAGELKHQIEQLLTRHGIPNPDRKRLSIAVMDGFKVPPLIRPSHGAHILLGAWLDIATPKAIDAAYTYMEELAKASGDPFAAGTARKSA